VYKLDQRKAMKCKRTTFNRTYFSNFCTVNNIINIGFSARI